MRRVLILSCSQRKRPDPGPLPAIDRYDGPAFRVLRRYLRHQPADPPDTYIISAEFGLIPADRPIPYYDRRMTATRARQLQAPVTTSLRAILRQADGTLGHSQVLVNLGKMYHLALDGCGDPTASVLAYRSISGGLGARLTQLKDWLYSSEPCS